jgi:carboxymethylproline synthase
MTHDTPEVHVDKQDNVAILQMNRTLATNPMNTSMNNAIIAHFKELEADDGIDAIVLTGGINRSFCAGGDFNEVQHLNDYPSVEAWIDRTIALYLAPATCGKPVIAALDNHAIGIGFQLALSCDWRVGADTSVFIMPELKHGISCTIGSYMLDRCLGRLRMQDIVLRCDPINADTSLEYGLIHEKVSGASLIEAAIKRAALLSQYPKIPFSNTKRVMNKPFIEGLLDIANASKSAHAESFKAKTSQAHMKRILKSH